MPIHTFVLGIDGRTLQHLCHFDCAICGAEQLEPANPLGCGNMVVDVRIPDRANNAQ
jgi:hypothetical protein